MNRAVIALVIYSAVAVPLSAGAVKGTAVPPLPAANIQGAAAAAVPAGEIHGAAAFVPAGEIHGAAAVTVPAEDVPRGVDVVRLLIADGADWTADSRHPSPGASPHRYKQGKSALGIPFGISGNHIILPVRINGSRVLDVVLDTGMPARGIGIIHPELCDELGLECGESGDASVVLSLPGIEFLEQDLVVFADSITEGWPGDGVIGYTIFGSCVVEIDYDRRMINLYDPASFMADDAGEALELKFMGNTPFVEAAVILDGRNEIPVNLLLDTGFGLALILFADSDGDIRPPENAIGRLLGTGLSGDISGKLGRITALRLGSFELHDMLAGFADHRTPLPGGKRSDGILGNWALRRFNAVIDYPGGRMFVKPNGHFEKPFEYNMTGLLLRGTHGGLKMVCDVIDNSPGALSGIEKGDIIVAVNGRDVREYDDDELFELLREVNETVEVTVQRGSEKFRRRLTLKRLI